MRNGASNGTTSAVASEQPCASSVIASIPRVWLALPRVADLPSWNPWMWLAITTSCRTPWRNTVLAIRSASLLAARRLRVAARAASISTIRRMVAWRPSTAESKAPTACSTASNAAGSSTMSGRGLAGCSIGLASIIAANPIRCRSLPRGRSSASWTTAASRRTRLIT